VHIGTIRLAGVSAVMRAKANALIGSQTGNGFDTENTAVGLRHAFEDLYQDDGYAAAQVEVARIDPPVISGKSSEPSIDIPFTITIKERELYKLGSINYPADALVPRAEVAKVLSKFQAASGRPLDLFQLAVRDAYHAKGYLECFVTPHASLIEETHIVNYNLNIVPGPLYKMGAVQFDGATGVTAAKLARQWKLTQGQAFDESYVSSFAARAQKQDRSLAKWLQTVVTTYDVKADAATHQVNCVFHFAKAT
jgi:outer membrane protein assembly factor BamA